MLNHKNLLLMIAVFVMLFFISCEKSTKSSDEKIIDKLTGTWYSNTEELTLEVTSNIDQNLIDIIRPGEGKIDVIGDFSCTLTELQPFIDPMRIMALDTQLDENTKSIVAWINENGASISKTYQDDSIDRYITESVDFTYDSTLSRLDINQCKLYKYNSENNTTDSTKFVILDGTLSNIIYTFEKDETEIIPLMIMAREDIFIIDKIEIEDSGIWKRTTYQDDLIVGSYTGEWEIEKDSIFAYETNDSTTVKDTIKCSFSVSDDMLSLFIKENVPADESDFGLYSMIEMLYNAKEKSISQLIMINTYTYTQFPVNNSSKKMIPTVELSPLINEIFKQRSILK